MNSTEADVVTLDLGDVIEPTHDLLTGASWGRDIRTRLDLDRYDREGTVVRIHVPDWVIALTSSFVRGLLQASILNLGEDRFRERYVFDFAGYDFTDIIDEEIDLALQPESRPEGGLA